MNADKRWLDILHTVLPNACRSCGSRIYQGFARCRNPACRAIREEFREFPNVVVSEIGHCVLSGAASDVRLPSGDYLWSPYFVGFLRAGLIDAELSYTATFYELHRHLR